MTKSKIIPKQCNGGIMKHRLKQYRKFKISTCESALQGGHGNGVTDGQPQTHWLSLVPDHPNMKRGCWLLILHMKKDDDPTYEKVWQQFPRRKEVSVQGPGRGWLGRRGCLKHRPAVWVGKTYYQHHKSQWKWYIYTWYMMMMIMVHRGDNDEYKPGRWWWI